MLKPNDMNIQIPMIILLQ